MKLRFWNRTSWILWVLLVCALPLSSVPLVARLVRSTSVAPASLLFLIPLVLVSIPSMFVQNSRLPFHIRPAILFFCFAVATIGLAFFRAVPDYKDQTLSAAALEGVVTLGLGFLFYLVALSMPNSVSRVDKTLRVLNWVGLALITWSILAVVIKQFVPALRPMVNQFQALISVTRVGRTRMTGFASEPSWLAHMLNLVFLAYWLAATVTRTSVHKWRLWKFSFENLLLIGGVIVLVGTYSRGGLAAFMLVIGFLFILLNLRLIRWLTRRTEGVRRRLLGILSGAGLVLIYAGLLVGGVFVLSKVDPRMEDVFTFSENVENPLIRYADSLQFGDRVVYWQTGWNIFNQHPIAGVGVGFSGFYFKDNLPDAGWGLTETKDLLYRSNALMNVKNIWSRLLAETGLIGFALFIALLFVSAVTSIDMVKSDIARRRALGFMGVFMLIALLIEGFSVDSFALPYIWFTLGLTAAAWRWYFPQESILNG